jgi:hypothetical protein
VKHKQSSSETQLVEITEDQGKEIVSNMKVLSEVEVQKVTAAGTIANKQRDCHEPEGAGGSSGQPISCHWDGSGQA